jgi:CheY-like chemotaxis protein
MGKKTILLGEDENDIAQMYKVIFEQNDFEVVLAGNGEEVIIKLKEKIPDILLLDINMPVKDGFEVLQTIADDSSLSGVKNIPIVMLTNYDNIQDVEYCMKMGAKDYIVKAEWTPEIVVQKVKKNLGLG